MTDDERKTKTYGPKEIGMDLVSLIATHWITFPKTLIQIGHEPLPSYMARDWRFWNTSYYRPGVFPYARHIINRDGFLGCWRGLTPRIWSALIYNFSKRTTSNIVDKVWQPDDEEPDVTKDSSTEVLFKASKKCLRASISEIAATVLSQPFHVMAIRSMCQFISREDVYGSFLSSIVEIKENEGAGGFLSGLIPRCVGAVLGIWLIEYISFGIKKVAAIAEESEVEEDYKDEMSNVLDQIRAYSNIIAGLLVSTFIYPYQLTSIIMSTKGSRLGCASTYDHWTECLSDLKFRKAHQRGSKIYFGRTVETLAHLAAYTNITPGITL